MGSKGQAGFTLVEVIAAIGVFVLVSILAMSVILVADQISALHVVNADKNQQLRSALKMMADDLVFAQWDTSCTTPPDFSNRTPVITKYVRNVAGYVLPDPPAPGGDATWPSPWTQTNWGRVCVYYGIEGDALIRETYRNSNRYSRRTVLTGLHPDSVIDVMTTEQSVKVTLKTAKEGTEHEYFEVSTRFFIP